MLHPRLADVGSEHSTGFQAAFTGQSHAWQSLARILKLADGAPPAREPGQAVTPTCVQPAVVHPAHQTFRPLIFLR